MSMRRSQGATPGFGSNPYQGILDYKPTIDTPDDEFGSSTLDGKWTAVTGSSGTVDLAETGEVEKYDLATRPGWLLMQAGSAADQKVELRQDFTLPDGASIVVAMSNAISVEGNSIVNNELWSGISINDNDAGYAAGEYSAIFNDVQANGYRPAFYDGSDLSGLALSTPMGTMQYFRMDRDGTSIYGYASMDGSTWMPFGPLVRSGTATNLWIFAESVAAAQDPVPIQAVKWIRQGTSAFDPW
jgi:hypothetical protein